MKICGELVIMAYADDMMITWGTIDEIINKTCKPLKASKSLGVSMYKKKTIYLSRIISKII